jgi:hypothetical protein
MLCFCNNFDYFVGIISALRFCLISFKEKHEYKFFMLIISSCGHRFLTKSQNILMQIEFYCRLN